MDPTFRNRYFECIKTADAATLPRDLVFCSYPTDLQLLDEVARQHAVETERGLFGRDMREKAHEIMGFAPESVLHAERTQPPSSPPR